MCHRVKDVKHIDKYNLRLTFEDGKTKDVDLSEMLANAKNLFIPLTKPSYFKKVKCDGTTIYWPNGVDLCPDVLYEKGKDLY